MLYACVRTFNVIVTIIFFSIIFFRSFSFGVYCILIRQFHLTDNRRTEKKLQQAMSLPRVTVASGSHANFRSIDATEISFSQIENAPRPYANAVFSCKNFRV